MDLIVTNGTVLTLDESLGIIHNGAVGVNQDRIAFVGAARDCPGLEQASRVIDAKNGIIMPGLINAYGHAGLRLFRATGTSSGFTGNPGWCVQGPALNRESVRLGVSLACAEMILSGTTCFNDRGLLAGEVASAASAAGMRAVCCQVVDLPAGVPGAGPEGGSGPIGLDGVARLLEAWDNHSLVSISAAPRDLGQCPDTLRALARLCQDHGGVMSIPVAETVHNGDLFLKRHGKTSVALLESLGLLGPGVLMCHGACLSLEDQYRLERHGSALVHTPLADLVRAAGVAPVPELAARGVCVGLGTGGGGRCHDLDLFRTMDITAKIHKVFAGDPEVADAVSVVKMATLHGASALGLSGITGSLCPGKKADLIVVDTSGLHMQPMYNPYSHLVYAASGHDVILTVINGRVVMADRRLTGMDLGQVMDTARPFGLFAFKSDNGEDLQSR